MARTDRKPHLGQLGTVNGRHAASPAGTVSRDTVTRANSFSARHEAAQITFDDATLARPAVQTAVRRTPAIKPVPFFNPRG